MVLTAAVALILFLFFIFIFTLIFIRGPFMVLMAALILFFN